MSRDLRGRYLAAAAVTGLLWPAGVHAADDAALVEQGRQLLTANCSRCHALGKSDASPFKDAPPFREIHRKYPPGQLAEALAEGITTGHPAMPEFVFKPDEIDAAIAYLESFKAE